MHISIFHSIKAPLVGQRFAYGTLAEDYQGNDVVAKVAFLNATAQIGGMATININHGEMPSSDDILKVFTSRKFTPIDNEVILADLDRALKQESSRRAEDIAKLYVRQLAGELLSWRSSGLLSAGSELERLALTCAEYGTAGDHFQEAERLVVIAALQFAQAAL